MTPLLTIERFPFFVGPVDPAAPSALPATMPFAASIDPRYGLVRQSLTPPVRAALAAAYAKGSMLSTPAGSSTLAAGRLKVTVDGIATLFGGELLGRSFLELGCGEGGLLEALQSRGGQVAGVEIGPQGQRAAQRLGIEVQAQPLRPGSFGRKFDCVLTAGALEHIEEVEATFEAIRDHLAPGGVTFHEVPSLETTYQSLRKDELAHEHVSYFTAASASATLAAEGFEEIGTRHAGTGNNMLQMWGRWRGRGPQPADPAHLKRETEGFEAFVKRLDESWEQERRFMAGIIDAGQSLGLYAGGFISAVVLGFEQRVSYFDGDQAKHGLAWLHGLPAIRSPRTLRDSPVDHLAIIPTHHFEAIEHALRGEIGMPARVTLHRGFA